ncbi:MAG: GWxTD domain-containing protein [Bacteroidales bacterium]
MLSHKAYCTDKMNPYIEFTFWINGQSVNYVLNKDKKYEAEVEIKVDIKKEDSIVKTLQYVLGSSLFSDSLKSNKPDFVDIQNLAIPNGEYFLHFSMVDLHKDSSMVEYIDHISINFPDDKVSTSGVTLLKDIRPAEKDDPFAKYGFSFTPLYYNFVRETQFSLPFFMEVYNTEKVLGKGQPIYAKCYIEALEKNQLALPQTMLLLNLQTAPVVIVHNQFNIFKLPSGNYNLIIELLDQDSTMMTQNKIFFQRSNPEVSLELSNYENVGVENTFVDKITDKKILDEYVSCLYPISSRMEQDFYNKRMKTVSFNMLQKFFYSFWITRNPNDPEEEWNKYYQKVQYVQNKYGSKLVKGYRTDRGRVYLQYGEPNNIVEAPFDPMAYPYEIWHYYHLEGQSNVKFVFYAPAVVTNDYELLHSDKYGEPHDTSWQMKLVKRMIQQYNPDIKKPGDYFGGDLDDNWRLHR